MNIWKNRNQETIITQVQAKLKGLVGWEWGQCGDLVFFVQGAYRDEKANIKTFTCVVLNQNGQTLMLNLFVNSQGCHSLINRQQFPFLRKSQITSK